jgi:hypothetical protein
MTDQYFDRICKLYVGVIGGDGIDLSELHIVFNIHQNDFESPNHAEIKVHNLNRDTMSQIQAWGENAIVHLEAGYVQNNTLETIFHGTISQMRVGRENETDTFVEMLCMDGDILYNDNAGWLSTTVAAGSTQKQTIDQITQSLNAGKQQAVMNISQQPAPSEGKYWSAASLRGKVLWGMPRNMIRNVAQQIGYRWSIQNGQVQFVAEQGYLPGDAIVLNPSTGLVGTPTQTDNGIVLRSLLNPKIKISSLIQLNESLINQEIVNSMTTYDRWAGLVNAAPLAADPSVYCVLVAEHHGDNRGREWYTDMTAMAVDMTTGKVVLAA